MKHTKELVLGVIRSYAAQRTLKPPVSPVPDDFVEHIYQTGLASIARQAIDPADLSDASQHLLRSADATARVIHRRIRNTAAEFLRLAHAHDIPVVLLKGISLADAVYAEPHHRIMGDLDLLVPKDKAQTLFDTAIDHGYQQPDEQDRVTIPEGHHHLPEIRDQQSGVPVEIHTALISRTLLADEPMFQRDAIWDYVEATEFDGIPCFRLCAEYRFLYTLAHWAIDYKWPTNLISLTDTLLSIQDQQSSLDWRRVRALAEQNPVVADLTATILSYFEHVELGPIPKDMRDSANASLRGIGKRNVRILHWLLSQFPLSGRRKVGRVLSRSNARIVWLTLLEPRFRWWRLPAAGYRILFRRRRGESLVDSTAGRISNLMKPDT